MHRSCLGPDVNGISRGTRVRGQGRKQHCVLQVQYVPDCAGRLALSQLEPYCLIANSIPTLPLLDSLRWSCDTPRPIMYMPQSFLMAPSPPNLGLVDRLQYSAGVTGSYMPTRDVLCFGTITLHLPPFWFWLPLMLTTTAAAAGDTPSTCNSL